MIAIDNVRQITGVLVPEFLFESSAAFIEERLPTRGKFRANGERVQPERLNFHWLANTRSDLAAIDTRIHPGELLAVFASREQSVSIGPDAESSSFIVTSKNRFDCCAQSFSMTIVGQRRL